MVAQVEDQRLGCTDCERLRDGAFAQPVNTVTSAAYVVAAGVMAVRAAQQPAHRAECLGYGALLALVGAGSIAFHGPQPRGARAMHDLPIVAVAALSVISPAVRGVRHEPALPGWSRRRGLALAATSAAAALAWIGGRTGSPLCRPDSRWQLHGAWHVLSAVAFVQGAGLLYGEAEARR